jgi:ABC-2 type transport system permease protein
MMMPVNLQATAAGGRSALSDAWIVFRKELIELVGDRRTFRGALGQTAILILFLGIYLPSSDSTMWNNPTMMAVIFFLFPSLLAATVAADSFAGERERGTLETLLATPLSDASLFFGKAGWAIFYSFSVSAVALLAGLTTTMLRYGSLQRYVPWVAVAVAAGDALVAAVFTSSVAVLISTKFPVVRAAEQVSRVVSIVAGALLIGIAHAVTKGFGWPAVFAVQTVLLLAGVAAIGLSAARFRRSGLFDRR